MKDFKVSYASRVYSNRTYTITGTMEFSNDNELITNWIVSNVEIELDGNSGYVYCKPALGCEETKEFERQLESNYFMKLDKYSPEWGGSNPYYLGSKQAKNG